MPIKSEFRTLLSAINAAKAGNSSSNKPLPDGTYSMKLVNAEKAISKKGKSMARLTFEVLDTSEWKGKQVKSYTVIQDPDVSQAWKYATLMNTAVVAYAIPEDKLCDEDTETLADVLENTVSVLSKSKYCGKEPVVPITMTRKTTGTDADGNPQYRDWYHFGEAPAESITDDEVSRMMLGA